MLRRTFLKIAGSAIATAALPASLLADSGGAYAGFDPSKGYGDWVVVTTRLNEETYGQAVDVLSKQIIAVIPPKYRKRIVPIVKQAYDSKQLVFWDRDYNRPAQEYPPLISTVGWKYAPKGCDASLLKIINTKVKIIRTKGIS